MSEPRDLSLKASNDGHLSETAVERVEDVQQHAETEDENPVQQIHAKTFVLLIVRTQPWIDVSIT